MDRIVIFVHGRGPKDLSKKEQEWTADLAAALQGTSARLKFASYSHLAYGKVARKLRPFLLLYDFLRWFAPLPGRRQRRMRLAEPLSDLTTASTGSPLLIVCHSFGALLAYQFFVQAGWDQGSKTWFLTIGSPLSWVPWPFLGVKKKAPPSPAVERWANMFHQADPVAGARILSPLFRDPLIADDYRADDPLAPEQPVDWAIYHFEADPHDDDGYLRSRPVRNIVRAFSNGEDWPFDAVTREYRADMKVEAQAKGLSFLQFWRRG